MKIELPALGSLATALVAGAALTALLSPPVAIGYPAGVSISSGTNPVVSQGGTTTFSSSPATVMTAPSDQDVILTDLYVGMSANSNNCFAEAVGTIGTPAAPELAVFSISRLQYTEGTTFQLESGIRIPAGESATLTVRSRYLNCSSSNYEMHYFVTGYTAQP